jgi:hypothetical protein
MMHGRGKSDPGVVAVKPANKALAPLRSRSSQGRGPSLIFMPKADLCTALTAMCGCNA